MEFIKGLKTASLDDEGMQLDPDALERLQNPPQTPPEISDPELCLALDLFLAIGNASQETCGNV